MRQAWPKSNACKGVVTTEINCDTCKILWLKIKIRHGTYTDTFVYTRACANIYIGLCSYAYVCVSVRESLQVLFCKIIAICTSWKWPQDDHTEGGGKWHRDDSHDIKITWARGEEERKTKGYLLPFMRMIGVLFHLLDVMLFFLLWFPSKFHTTFLAEQNQWRAQNPFLLISHTL